MVIRAIIFLFVRAESGFTPLRSGKQGFRFGAIPEVYSIGRVIGTKTYTPILSTGRAGITW